MNGANGTGLDVFQEYFVMWIMKDYSHLQYIR